MKKFFSIFCALAIVLSVTAAPVSKKDFADKKDAKKELRQHKAEVKKAPARMAEFKSFEKKAVKGFEKKAAIKEFKAANRAVAKAPQAKKEAINLSFTSADADVSWEDHCADAGWWQIQAETDEYYVTLSNLSAEEAAGEYAWEDLDPDYCAIWYEGASDLLAFTDGSCTVAVDETDGLKVTVEGSFVCVDGNTYNLHIEFAKEAIVAEDIEFVAVSESHSFYASGNDVYFTFRDADENVIHFDIIVAEGLEDVEEGKEYTLADMLESYSNVTYNEEKADFVEASFVKIPLNGGEKYEATAVDTYGRKFHLAYTFIEPVAEQFESITADVTLTKEAILFWTQYTFEAQDAANAIVLELIPDEEIFGTWAVGDDITGSVTPLNGIESEIYSGEVTIEQTAEGFKITGKVLCFNNTEYTLDLTYVIPDATREAELTLENLELAVLDGAWQLSGFSADSTQFISVAAFADEVSGTYTESDLAGDYTYLYTDLEFDEEGNMVDGKEFSMLKANLEVTFNEADSTILINGTFRGQNGEDIPEFTLALSGRIPTPEVSDMTFEFADEEEGIRVTPSNDDDAWDWYVVDEATFEYNGADHIAEVIYGKYGNTYAVTGEQLLSFEGDLANYLTASGTFYLVVWGAGKNNITTEVFVHEFEYESGLPEGCTQYDAEEGNDFIVDFAEFEIDERLVEQYNVYIIKAKDDDNNNITLQIYAPEGLEDGEYPVLEDSEEPFVISGELDLSEGKIYGSFAGVLTTQGYSAPLWLLIDGTVTIAGDVITVDAVNCAGAKIQCVLGEAQAINNTDAAVKAAKVVRNGQLIIIKNGVEYNAQGAVVK